MESDLKYDKLEEILQYYCSKKQAGSQENLVLLLQEIQELYNCIPLDIQEILPEKLNVKPAVIQSLIKYSADFTSAPYRHKITFCVGERCAKQQAFEILRLLKQEIQHKPFQLITQNCMKHCGSSPNLRINDDFYTNVLPENIHEIIIKYN